MRFWKDLHAASPASSRWAQGGPVLTLPVPSPGQHESTGRFLSCLRLQGIDLGGRGGGGKEPAARDVGH